MPKNSWGIRRRHNFGTTNFSLSTPPPPPPPLLSLFFCFLPFAGHLISFISKEKREYHEDRDIMLKEVHFSVVCLNELSSFRYGSKDLAPSSLKKYMGGSYKVPKVSMSIKIDDVTSDTRDEAPHWRLWEITPC